MSRPTKSTKNIIQEPAVLVVSYEPGMSLRPCTGPGYERVSFEEIQDVHKEHRSRRTSTPDGKWQAVF